MAEYTEQELEDIISNATRRGETAAVEAVEGEIQDIIPEDHPQYNEVRSEVFSRINV